MGKLGVSSGLMIILGYPGELLTEADADIKSKIKMAQIVTVVSWLTYPIVYIIPMMGATGSSAVVGIQVGYCISDVISKCGVGFIIYRITLAKSQATDKHSMLPNSGAQVANFA